MGSTFAVRLVDPIKEQFRSCPMAMSIRVSTAARGIPYRKWRIISVTVTPQFLAINSIPQTFDATIPEASALLRVHPCATLLLFWDRQLHHLHHSAQLRPHLLGSARHWCGDLTSRIHNSLHIALDLAVTGRERTGSNVELAVTVLVGGRERSNELDVCLHLGFYVPQVYGTVGAHLAVVGPGRGGKAEVFRLGKERKELEKMRIGRSLRGVSYCQTMGITFLKAMSGISSLCVERMSVDMKCIWHCK